MKYGFNVAPIAGPRKQYGAGVLGLALSGQGALTKATKGSGTMALALSGTLAGQKVPRVTGIIDMHLGVTGNLSGVFFMAGMIPMALQASDHAINPIAVKLSGALPMVLSARYGMPDKIAPGAAGMNRERRFAVAHEPRRFTIAADNDLAVPSEPRRLAIPPQGGL